MLDTFWYHLLAYVAIVFRLRQGSNELDRSSSTEKLHPVMLSHCQCPGRLESESFASRNGRFCDTSIGLPNADVSQLPRRSADLALLSLRSALHRGLNVGSETDREERAQGGQSCSSAAASVFTPWRIASSSVLA
jgi:hypothetical protein